MLKISLSIAALLLGISTAEADYSVTAGTGTTVKAGVLSGGVVPWANIVDASGNVMGNPTYPWVSGYSVGGVATPNTGSSYGQFIDVSASSTLYSLLTAALPAGANAIGTVGVTALPALPAGSNAIGTVGVTALPALPTGTNTIGAVTYPSADPCISVAHTFTPISITAATQTQVVTATSGKKIYICSMMLITGASNNVGIVEGTGTTCQTSTAGVIGGTTAANGVNLVSSAGFSIGNGSAAAAATATVSDNLCLWPSSVGPLSGVLVTVQQ